MADSPRVRSRDSTPGRPSASVQALLVIAALVVIAAGIKSSGEVVVPFLLSIFIATIAATPVYWMEQRRVPAPLAITLTMVAIVLALMTITALIVQSGSAFTERLPFYQERVDSLVGDLVNWLGPLGIEMNADLALSYFNPATALVLAGNLLKGLGSVLGDGFLILLTVIFILAEASSFPKKLRTVLADPEHDLAHFTRFAINVNRYIAIKTSTSLATGLLVSLVLLLLGVDFPILWGLVAFLLNYVPTIGSIIAAVPAVLLALIQLGPIPALVATGCYVAINIGMGNVVEPRFMGRALSLSTLVVFLSLLVWGWLLGPVGMLLSVPLTMTAKIALEANPSSAWIAHLLGPAEQEQAGPPPADAPIDEQQPNG